MGKSPQDSGPPDVSTGSRPDGAAAKDMVDSRQSFIEQALAEYESPLIGFAYGMLKDADRARDVVQDTFIRLCRQDVSKVRDSLKSWLFTVCRNRALDVLRKEGRLRSLDDPELRRPVLSVAEEPSVHADREERLEMVMRYLDRLPENQKTVILLKFRDGLSYQEITEKTGLSGGNVGFLIHTGLKRIRQLLPPDLLDGY